MTTLFFIFLFVFLILINIFFISLIFYSFTLAPWLPMNKVDLERINRLADLGEGESFVEIGSGDGRVCSYIAEKNLDAEVIGIEINWALFILSYIRKLIKRQKNLKLILKSAMNYDMHNVDVVYAYITAKALNKSFKPKVLKEMKNGSKFISYFFKFKEWQKKVRIYKPQENGMPIFVYEF